jgi:hypothetical protein
VAAFDGVRVLDQTQVSGVFIENDQPGVAVRVA